MSLSPADAAMLPVPAATLGPDRLLALVAYTHELQQVGDLKVRASAAAQMPPAWQERERGRRERESARATRGEERETEREREREREIKRKQRARPIALLFLAREESRETGTLPR